MGLRLFHFIPAHEESLHEISNECSCDPTLVSGDELDDLDDYLIGETVYAHNPLTEARCERFVVKS